MKDLNTNRFARGREVSSCKLMIPLTHNTFNLSVLLQGERHLISLIAHPSVGVFEGVCVGGDWGWGEITFWIICVGVLGVWVGVRRAEVEKREGRGRVKGEAQERFAFRYDR